MLTDAVYKGAWQTLEVLPLAVWAAGTGVLLWGRRPSAASVTSYLPWTPPSTESTACWLDELKSTLALS